MHSLITPAEPAESMNRRKRMESAQKRVPGPPATLVLWQCPWGGLGGPGIRPQGGSSTPRGVLSLPLPGRLELWG